MKIIQVHNEYLFPGGEDAVAASEAAMLRSFGHQVVEYRRSNKEIRALSPFQKATFYLNDIFFSRATYSAVRDIIKSEKPDIAHFHNSFFMVGIAAYEACFDADIPVVQTLHNYRFFCAGATFYRNGKVCEECLSGGRMFGVLHRCWHQSLAATALMTWVIRSYERRNVLQKIHRFIALNNFSFQKFVDNGWDSSKISVKPNFLDWDPGAGEFYGKYVLYVGALQPYKGVATLLNAWRRQDWSIPLKIAGSGPMEQTLRLLNVPGVEWCGQQDAAGVFALMKGALCLVVPSECYETFGRVIIEAYACGIPVVASRLGALPELVIEGVTGCLFTPGSETELSEILNNMISDRDKSHRMGQAARHFFEAHYTAEQNYRQLKDIYQRAIDDSQSRMAT